MISTHPQQFPRQRIYAAALVLIAELACLAWEYFHGGVPSHHFLHRADMPSISNWWGALVLPVLTWYLVGRIQRRVTTLANGNAMPALPTSVIAGFGSALLFGVAMSICFVSGYKTGTEYLFMAMLLAAVLLPVFRAECVLGFVLGMAFVFGAILPTLIGSIIATISALIYFGVRPLLFRLFAWRGRA